MSEPLVSVVIPVFKRFDETVRATKSVMDQTYDNMEILLVDDCSPDDTHERLSEFVEDLDGMEVSLHRTEENHGNPSMGRNIGILKSRGEYIALLDNDDWFLPEKIAKQVELFEVSPNKVGLVYSGYQRVYNTGEVIRDVVPRYRGNVYRQLLMNNFVGSCTPMIRRSVFDDVGMYDEEIPLFEDREMMMRIARCYHFDYVLDILACYQHTLGQLSKQLSHNPLGIEGREYILQKYMNDISEDPDILARHYHWLGCNCFIAEYMDKARRYERMALKCAPNFTSRWANYLVAYLLMYLSRRVFLKLTAWNFKKWGD